MTTVYTSNKCTYCPMVKKFLAMKGVEYEERDINDDGNMEAVQKLTGQQRIPVVVTDKGVSVGYNIPSLSSII